MVVMMMCLLPVACCYLPCSAAQLFERLQRLVLLLYDCTAVSEEAADAVGSHKVAMHLLKQVCYCHTHCMLLANASSGYVVVHIHPELA